MPAQKTAVAPEDSELRKPSEEGRSRRFLEQGLGELLELGDGQGHGRHSRDARTTLSGYHTPLPLVTRAAGRRWLVRGLRLAGNAALPEFFEIDDSLVGPGDDGQSADLPHLTG